MSDTPTRAQKMRERAANKREKAKALMARADAMSANYPGSFITGASGRSRAQNRGTERALNATINAAVRASRLHKEADELDRRAWAIENPQIIAEIRAERAQERQQLRETEKAQRKGMTLEQRLFVGKYPNALVYGDMAREKNGDFLRVANLYYSDLTVKIYEEKSPLLPMVLADIERVQAMKGQQYQVSASGQTVLLGWKLPEVTDGS